MQCVPLLWEVVSLTGLYTMNLQAITRCSQVLHVCLTCDARALLL